MVHLAAIPKEDEKMDHVTKQVKKTHLAQIPDEDDCYTTSVYGSKFAIADLPKHEMPEHEMPKGK
jgi:glutamate decarboxylase